MLTAILLLGSMVSSPVTSALAVMPVAASPTFPPGVTCDFTVDNDTSLQAAIATSVDDSVICIAASIQLNAPLTLANTSVALVGPVNSAVTLTAPPTARHITATATVPGDDTLVIDTLTLRGGNVPAQGGIVVNNYAIEIRGSSLRENNALERGGALEVGGIGSVIITDTVFLNNTAAGVDGGGAIFVANGDITIDDSASATNFSNNAATNAVGSGGAIYVGGAGGITASGGTFTNNTAGFGGGAIYAPFGNVTITGTTAFTDNDAANGYGGAIYAFNGDVTVDDSPTFTNNSAADSGGAINAVNGSVTIGGTSVFERNIAHSGYGGSIYAGDSVTTSGGSFTDDSAAISGGAIFASTGSVTISGTTDFRGNTADNGDGGAISADGTVTTSGGIFDGNTAGTRGGAIFANTGSVTISETAEFTGNTADSGGGGAIYADGTVTTSGGTFTDNTTGLSGGGMASGGAIHAVNGSVTIGGTTAFERNIAHSGYGGSIYARFGSVATSGGSFTDDSAAESGGSIYTESGSVTIGGATDFLGNTADSGDGGAIYAHDTVTISGGSFTDNFALGGGGSIFANTGSVTISETAEFTGNTADSGGGGAIYADGTVTTSGGTFTDNTTGYSGGGTASGGAIHAVNGSVTIGGTTAFERNIAHSGYGGSIYARFGSVATSGGSFTDDSAAVSGGSIYTESGSVTIGGATDFLGNTADSGDGGAIYAGGTVTTSGGTFSDDSASGNGGAIYAFVNVIIDDTASTTNFVRNSAEGTDGGGAIFARTGFVSIADDASFGNNRAANGSGGAINSNLDITVSDGAVSDNTAFNHGGALYSRTGGITTGGSTFTGNTAVVEGGAIWAFGTILLTNSTFLGNSANTGGAALSQGGGFSVYLRYVTAVDDSANLGEVVFDAGGTITIVGSVIAPDPTSGSACSTSADDSSYNSFVTDPSCGSGDDTVVVTSREDIGLSGPLVIDDSTGAQVLIPDDTSVLINAAPADLVAGVTTDQLQATRGRSPDDSTTVGAVQVLPLVITGQPASTTVAAGATATFAASGIPGVGTTVNYQWQTSVNGGQTWVDRVGATSPTLTLPAVTGSQNGLRVRAQLRDLRNDPSSTNAAVLSVTVPPPGPTPGPTPPGPSSEPPGPPAVVVAAARDRSARVAWSPPASSGTRPVREYEVESFPKSAGCKVTVPETSCTVTGLRNGSGYVFRVRASSAVGWGPWSAFTRMVTPQPVASVTITGTRSSNDPLVIRIRGRSTGFVGKQLTPYVRVSGRGEFVASSRRPTVGKGGGFSWQRRSAQRVTIYFAVEGVQSNLLTFSAVRRSES